MIHISQLSGKYKVRMLQEADVDLILELYRQNPLFFRYTNARPTVEQILEDMRLTPPEIDASDKYYIGFFNEEKLIAVMDLIDGYPNPDTAFIGYFMMNSAYQGKQIGTAIIDETTGYLKAVGKKSIRLAIDKGNPQSTHFWKKNGFVIISEADVDGWPKLVAEKAL